MRTPLIEKILNTAETNKILVEKFLDGYEKGEAEGESINITDSANLPMILRPQGKIIQDTRNGYNLLNITNYTDSANLISSIDNGKIVITSKKNSEYNYEQVIFFNDIELKAGTTYTLSKKMEIISGTPFAVTGLAELYKENSWIKVISIGSATEFDSKASFNVEEDGIYRIRFKFVNAESAGEEIFSVSLSNLMIYEGSEEKEYEEYGQMPSTSFPSPIKNVEGDYKIENVNSNLYDINDLSEKNGNIQIDKDDWISGTIDNSSGSGYVFLNFFSRKKDYIKANKKYYVLLEVKEVSGTGRLSISSDFQGSSQFTSFGYNFSNLKSNSKYLSEITTINDFSKTIFALRSYLQFQSGESGSITFRLSLLNNKPNLEEFIYKKYRSKILELNIPKQIKLYGENDRFVYLSKEQATELELDGEGWYVYNEWGEIVIVGTEKFIEIESVRTPKTYLYQFDYTKLMSTGNNILIGAKCNYFNEDTANNIWSTKTDLEGFSLNINHTLHIRTEIAPDLFKTWLEEKNTEGNPLKVVGKLVNPTYTKITDKNFIKQLEELQKVFSHEGTTNIDTCSTDDKEKAPLIISAEYLKSQKIINKNLETRLTALENALINNI